MNPSTSDSPAGAATLRALAARLGVGKSTVQRALANSPLVSPETKARVRAAAEESGYRVDAYFAALSAKRGRRKATLVRLDYLHQSTPDRRLRVGFDGYDRLRECGLRMGYDVRRAPHDEELRAESVVNALWARGSAGILVGRATPEMGRVLSRFGRVPMLALQRQEHLPLHTVRFDASGMVRECWDRLWAAGWRRIGCAVMRHAVPIDDDRDRLGAALELVTTRLDEGDRVPPLTAIIQDREAYFDWLRRHRPDAVIGFDTGFGVVHRDAGFGKVPFVGLHSSDWIMTRRIPGMALPLDEWGRQAIMRIDSLIRHGEIGVPDRPVHTVLPGVWRPGSGIRRRGA